MSSKKAAMEHRVLDIADTISPTYQPDPSTPPLYDYERLCEGIRRALEQSDQEHTDWVAGVLA